MASPTSNYDITSTITDETLYGKNIYLLGTAEFGPTNKPVQIKTTGQLKQQFGSKGSLIQAFKEINSVSPDASIYLVKTTGAHSLLYLNVNVLNSNIVEDGLIFKAKEAHQSYNNVKITLNNDSIIFRFPQELGGGYKQYYFKDYEILGLLVRQINEDTIAGSNLIYAQCIVESSIPTLGALTPVNPNESYMYGGDNGLFYYKNQYYYCLQTTYDLLEGEPVDLILPLEAYYDDLYPDTPLEGRDYLNLKIDNKSVTFYEQLLLYCIKQMRFGSITHGIIGLNPSVIKNETYITDVVKPNLIVNKVNADLINYTFLVSVIAGDLYYNSNETKNNSYTGYAGLISNLVISSSSTNVPLPQTVTLANTFTQEEVNELADLGIVSFRMSPLTNAVTVCNGVTSLSSTTDLHYLCNVRMLQLTLGFVNDFFELLIGEDVNTFLDQGIIEENLVLLLNFLKEKSILDAFEYQLIRNDDQGSLTLYLDLKTRYMIEYIRAVGGIRYQIR